MIIKKEVEKLITYEMQPDGGCTPIIDPYDGCSINCPYCFQKSDSAWNQNVIVKTNIVTLIESTLNNWDRNNTIYLGSRCDPYMSLEKKYELTRKCIIALNRLQLPIMIATKGDTELIHRDIEILSSYHGDLTILLGFSNMGDYISTKRIEDHPKIRLANMLLRNNVNVWAFITPVLPGITDVERISELLPDRIPIHLDFLRVNPSNRDSILRAIERTHVALLEEYEDIVNTETCKYFDAMKRKYSGNKRYKFLF